jgi:hypothetical protein
VVNRHRKYANIEWGLDVVNITFTVMTKDNRGKRNVLAEYPIRLLHEEHCINGTQPLANKREHYCWDFCPVSDWVKVETSDGTLNQIDHAFCEFLDESNLVEIKIYRFQSEGPDHANPKIYQVGSKLVCFLEEYASRDLSLQPTFDESNRITGCQLRQDRGEDEEAIYYPFNKPNE